MKKKSKGRPASGRPRAAAQVVALPNPLPVLSDTDHDPRLGSANMRSGSPSPSRSISADVSSELCDIPELGQ